MTGILRGPRRAALTAITVLVSAASLVSFAESYRGLWEWARHHGLHGIWAGGFPAQVDVFIAVGELALFVALADAWPARTRVAAWGVTILGLAVSVSGNVGHVAGHSLTNRATAAVPPLAAAAALAVGMGVLKRVVGAHHATAPAPEIGNGVTDLEASAEAQIGHVLADSATAVPGPDTPPVSVPASTAPALECVPDPRTSLNGAGHAAAERYSTELAAGDVPSIRRIRAEMRVGQPRAAEIQKYLSGLTPAGLSIAAIRAELRGGPEHDGAAPAVPAASHQERQ